ncbi:Hypothetical predicted protein [Paramuricea clavata]|uniref:Uncharacterized protein n=1 Tax=Paramuricea clavata TaxID=317549 RepID=A0A6S7IDL3_PARCT|nr:Hypothetical predicted protein [Paramuricea clavata]
MDEVTRGLDFVYVYIDDILIASTNALEHEVHLQLLFDRFRQYGVVINPAKSVFGVSSLEFLGHNVTAHGIQPLDSKVKAIRDFPLPTLLTKLREFLGLKIKNALADFTLLSHPKSDAELCLMTDASDVAVGAVLQQRVNNVWQPLGFFSKRLQPAENPVQHLWTRTPRSVPFYPPLPPPP